MNSAGKTRAVVEWARGWPVLEGYVKLNALDASESGDASVMPTYSDVANVEYIDGTAERSFVFELRMALPWSDGHDDVNVTSAQLSESWLDWVSDQWPANVPDFGEGASIRAIEPIQNIPTAAMVYAEQGMAEYSFSARIDYTE